MAQLTTAGGLISTLLAPEPTRFTATGAGVPHCSCLTGSDTSTSAAMGASSRTHSRKAAITWASDHTSGFGGSACAASGGLGSTEGDSGVFSGSGWEMEEVLCEGASVCLAAGLPAGGPAASWGTGSSASGSGSRFTRDRRAASWKTGSAGALSAIGMGLACTSSIGTGAGRACLAPIPEAASCGRTGSVASPRTAAIESLFDTETTDLARVASNFAAYAMLVRMSRRSRGIWSRMAAPCGGTVEPRAALWVGRAPS